MYVITPQVQGQSVQPAHSEQDVVAHACHSEQGGIVHACHGNIFICNYSDSEVWLRENSR